jgi:hypothetical protein
VDIVKWASHPPLGLVHGLTLLLAASEVGPDGGVFIHWPYWPHDGSEELVLQVPQEVGRGLTLDYPSHGLWLVGVTEELLVLPIIEVEIGVISSTQSWLLTGALGEPGDRGLIAGALP